MAVEQKAIYVYDDFSFEEPVLLGVLYIDVVRGGEPFSFEYDEAWLSKTISASDIDPELQAFSGRQYSNGKNIFGIFADASPDRWGVFL